MVPDQFGPRQRPKVPTQKGRVSISREESPLPFPDSLYPTHEQGIPWDTNVITDEPEDGLTPPEEQKEASFQFELPGFRK